MTGITRAGAMGQRSRSTAMRHNFEQGGVVRRWRQPLQSKLGGGGVVFGLGRACNPALRNVSRQRPCRAMTLLSRCVIALVINVLFRRCAELQGGDQRQCGLAFAEIIADIFAHLLRIAEVVQHVVGQLKGNAQMSP